MDEAGFAKSVQCIEHRNLVAVRLPDDLVHRPRPLIVVADEQDEHAPIVAIVIDLELVVRLWLHGKGLPFRATAPGWLQPARGPLVYVWATAYRQTARYAGGQASRSMRSANERSSKTRNNYEEKSAL